MSSPSSAIWDPAINPPPDAGCRGCDEPLWRAGDWWQDRRGVTVCVKLRMDDIGRGELPPYVFHQPLPTGLRGAPLTR